MVSIVVTGAAGAVGRRTVRQLAVHPDVERLVLIDRQPIPMGGISGSRTVETHRVDLLTDDLGPLFVGADSVVHLAEDAGRRDDANLAERMLHRVLDGLDAADCRHLIVLSSAMVYGANADNPVPITETHDLRANETLAYTRAKKLLEVDARAWAQETGGELAVLRPTTTLSERGVGWVAKTLRAATLVRPDQVDPPVQFLHHDDLASAVCVVARKHLTGVFNVAPDGWIGPEIFRDLIGGPQVRLPEKMNERVTDMRRLARTRVLPAGIEDYVRHPWVVANDRLRAEGWVPAFSNEEAFVLGTPAPPWAVSAQRRQEVALAVAGVATAGAMAAFAGITRRLVR